MNGSRPFGRLLSFVHAPYGPTSTRQRLDIGYMNLWNAITWVPAREINHTVTLNWVITSGN